MMRRYSPVIANTSSGICNRRRMTGRPASASASMTAVSAAMNANEIRACEDLDGYEGGDVFYRQTNLEPVNNDNHGE